MGVSQRARDRSGCHLRVATRFSRHSSPPIALILMLTLGVICGNRRILAQTEGTKAGQKSECSRNHLEAVASSDFFVSRRACQEIVSCKDCRTEFPELLAVVTSKEFRKILRGPAPHIALAHLAQEQHLPAIQKRIEKDFASQEPVTAHMLLHVLALMGPKAKTVLPWLRRKEDDGSASSRTEAYIRVVILTLSDSDEAMRVVLPDFHAFGGADATMYALAECRPRRLGHDKIVTELMIKLNDGKPYFAAAFALAAVRLENERLRTRVRSALAKTYKEVDRKRRPAHGLLFGCALAAQATGPEAKRTAWGEAVLYLYSPSYHEVFGALLHVATRGVAAEDLKALRFLLASKQDRTVRGTCTLLGVVGIPAQALTDDLMRVAQDKTAEAETRAAAWHALGSVAPVSSLKELRRLASQHLPVVVGKAASECIQIMSPE